MPVVAIVLTHDLVLVDVVTVESAVDKGESTTPAGVFVQLVANCVGHSLILLCSGLGMKAGVCVVSGGVVSTRIYEGSVQKEPRNELHVEVKT